MILGIDTGGTFTDFVLLDNKQLRIHKVLSTPAAPEQAILQGIAELGLMPAIAQDDVYLVHGSTVATNAALENKGVNTVFITNHGFTDLLTIGRQTRRELFDLNPPPPPPPVPSERCLGVSCRRDVHGNAVQALTETQIAALREHVKRLAPRAIAICLLHAPVNDEDERRLTAALDDLAFVCRSSAVLPIVGEYERGIATWLNATLGPLVNDYLQRLQQQVAPCSVAVMQSSGGTIDSHNAGRQAVRMLLSGPAGGLAGARYLGGLGGSKQLLTFDMGGTSTDVALIDGDIRLSDDGHIGAWPVAVPMVDMHTIGAGGGSLAYLDAGGALQVGPQSAGADPGPACYGRGGCQPTVTDANLILGRLPAEHFLGGHMPLDRHAAETAMAPLAKVLGLSLQDTALGIVRIANEHMARALRVISIQRGFRLDNFQLCSFGGAGGLHVCALADALKLDRALVPVHGGVLSALGMLVAPRARHLEQASPGLLEHMDPATLQAQLNDLAHQGREALLAEGATNTELCHDATIDLRYQGQGFCLNLPWQTSLHDLADAFHARHQSRFGHRLHFPVEVVNVRVSVSAPPSPIQLPTGPTTLSQPIGEAQVYGMEQACPVYRRCDVAIHQSITGPALLVEDTTTTLLAAGWLATSDATGNLLLRRIT